MESDNKDSVVSEIRPVKRKRRFRKAAIAAAIIAAVLLVAMTTLTVIARVNGYDSTLEWLSDHWGEYLNLGHGGQTTIDGITIIRQKGTKIYPDIESWLKEEKLEILYPSELPNEIKLDQVIHNTRDEGEVGIIFIFNASEIVFNAQNYDLSMLGIHDGMEIIEVNGYRFGIVYEPKLTTPYTAYFTVDGFAYTVGCKDRDTLLFMIEHLKKPES